MLCTDVVLLTHRNVYLITISCFICSGYIFLAYNIRTWINRAHKLGKFYQHTNFRLKLNDVMKDLDIGLVWRNSIGIFFQKKDYQSSLYDEASTAKISTFAKTEEDTPNSKKTQNYQKRQTCFHPPLTKSRATVSRSLLKLEKASLACSTCCS